MTWNFLCYLVVFNLSVFFTGIWTSIRPCRLWTWRTKTLRIKLFGVNTVFIQFEQFEQKSKNASENYFGGLTVSFHLKKNHFWTVWLHNLIFDIDKFGLETFVPWIWSRRGLQISGFEILRGLGVGMTWVWHEFTGGFGRIFCYDCDMNDVGTSILTPYHPKRFPDFLDWCKDRPLLCDC